MATNVYRYDELWYFGRKPERFHGWVLSLNDEYLKCAYFKSRSECNAVERAFKKELPEGVREDVVAACILIRRFGSEGDCYVADEVLKREFETEEAAFDEEDLEMLEALMMRVTKTED